MKNKVPERWEAYSSMGRQIPGTRFICFKVPLRKEIVQNAVRKGAEWFCPRTLMDHCLNLGLVVDLTYTDRFYDPKDFTSQGIRYDKILTQGKVIPKQKVIKQFFKIVNSFLEENKENDKLIGVHCTHGLNRTGYLVCRYMIEHLGIPPDQAIADFNSARGHNQEREDYLAHLRQMKWQQEPAAPDSDKEEAEGEGQQKTPTDNRRRSKRNFDAIRRPLPRDVGWVCEPEENRLEGNKRDQYQPRAHPEGPVALGSGSQTGGSWSGARPKSGFGGVYDSGAFSHITTKMTTMNLGPQDPSGSGPEPPTPNENITNRTTNTQAAAAPRHLRTQGRGHRGIRSRPPHTGANITTTTTIEDEWHPNTTHTSTNDRGRGWDQRGCRRGGRGMSTGRTAATGGRGSTEGRGNTRRPRRGRGRPWTNPTTTTTQ